MQKNVTNCTIFTQEWAQPLPNPDRPNTLGFGSLMPGLHTPQQFLFCRTLCSCTSLADVAVYNLDTLWYCLLPHSVTTVIGNTFSSNDVFIIDFIHRIAHIWWYGTVMCAYGTLGLHVISNFQPAGRCGGLVLNCSQPAVMQPADRNSPAANCS